MTKVGVCLIPSQSVISNGRFDHWALVIHRSLVIGHWSFPNDSPV